MQRAIGEQEELPGLQAHLHDRAVGVEVARVGLHRRKYVPARRDMWNRELVRARQHAHGTVAFGRLVDGDPRRVIQARLEMQVIVVGVPGDELRARLFADDARLPEQDVGSDQRLDAIEHGRVRAQIIHGARVQVSLLVGPGHGRRQHLLDDLRATLGHLRG
jgi:hypothetical protein